MNEEYNEPMIGMESEDDDLNFDFDTTKISKEKDLELSSGPVPDGKYHVLVESVAKESEGTPSLKFVFSVLAGTTPGQNNRKIHERLYLTEKTMQRVYLFANRLGLINTSEFGQPNVRKNWKETVGSQVIVEVQLREYDKRDGTKAKTSNITFGGIWKLDDESVKDVPRNSEAVAQASLLKRAPVTRTSGSPAVGTSTSTSVANKETADAYDDL